MDDLDLHDFCCLFAYCGTEVLPINLDEERTLSIFQKSSYQISSGWESFLPPETYPSLEQSGVEFRVAGTVVGRYASAKVRNEEFYIAACAPRGLCGDHPCPVAIVSGSLSMMRLSWDIGTCLALRGAIRPSTVNTVMSRWDTRHLIQAKTRFGQKLIQCSNENSRMKRSWKQRWRTWLSPRSIWRHRHRPHCK